MAALISLPGVMRSLCFCVLRIGRLRQYTSSVCPRLISAFSQKCCDMLGGKSGGRSPGGVLALAARSSSG